MDPTTTTTTVSAATTTVATISPPPTPPSPPTSAPQMLLNPPSLASAAASRRVPPPCWSAEETVALIDAYREKWYSLRRGNLRSHHWEEVAEQVASQFPANPKTCVQCRHKMEKLRKRYRGEKQRAAAFQGGRNSRFKSNWAHFKRMDDMEKGTHGLIDKDDEEDDEEEETGRLMTPNFVKPVAEIYRNNVSTGIRYGVSENRNVFQTPPMISGVNGYRVRVNERSAPVGVPGPKFYPNYDEFGVPKASVRSGFGGSGQVLRNEHGGRGEIGRKAGVDERKKVSPTAEMVEAIRVLGDRFVRAEKMKMDMAREVEGMRMEMEMKRTAMILDSQQQIVEAFANAVFGTVSKNC